MEEVDPVLDVVLDQHPLGIAADQVARRAVQLIGQQQGRFLMAQISDGQLAERTIVAVELDPAIQHSRRSVGARDAFEFDPSPSRRRGLGDLLEKLLGPPPQGDELDPQPVQLAELGIGRQLGVEDQLFGQAASPLLPELDEAEDLIITLVLTQLGIGVAENSSVGVLRQKRQAFPSAAGSAWRRSVSRSTHPRRERESCGSRGQTMFPSGARAG